MVRDKIIARGQGERRASVMPGDLMEEPDGYTVSPGFLCFACHTSTATDGEPPIGTDEGKGALLQMCVRVGEYLCTVVLAVAGTVPALTVPHPAGAVAASAPYPEKHVF